jgi:hypothetical protein
LFGNIALHGQIWFGAEYERGKLEFRKLILHDEISANEQGRREALKKLASVIDPRNIEDQLYINLVTGDEWKYVWTKSEKNFRGPSSFSSSSLAILI